MRALDTHAELSEALMRQILEALQSERTTEKSGKPQRSEADDPYEFIIEYRR